MTERRRARGIGLLAMTALLAACSRFGEPGAPAESGLAIRFEDRAEPQVFEREGPARRDHADGAAGRWATVPGLPRPERARVVNVASGAATVVALFVGQPGAPIRLSNEAADALGIGEEPATVHITALRSRPEVAFDPN